ncbi:MAG: hypothetical protein ABII27_02210 [bacterium]
MKKRFRLKWPILRFIYEFGTLEIAVSAVVFFTLTTLILLFSFSAYKYYRTGKNVAAAEMNLPFVLASVEKELKNAEVESIVIDAFSNEEENSMISFLIRGIKSSSGNKSEQERHCFYLLNDKLNKGVLKEKMWMEDKEKMERYLVERSVPLTDKISRITFVKRETKDSKVIIIELESWYFNLILNRKSFIKEFKSIVLK